MNRAILVARQLRLLLPFLKAKTLKRSVDQALGLGAEHLKLQELQNSEYELGSETARTTWFELLDRDF